MRQILLSTLCILVTGCFMHEKQDTSTNQSTAISVIGDITDRKQVWMKADPILQLYQFNQYPNAEAWFRLTTISDKQINPVFAYHLQNANDAEQFNTYGDEQFRKKNILGFYKQIRASIDTFYATFDTTASLGNSECFATIASELTKLQSLNARRKILLIFSDLMERSVFNAYSNKRNVSVEQIATALVKQQRIPNSLSGIQVFVVYRPTSRKEDQQVMKMIAAYKVLIENRGGVFEVRATNNL